MANAARNPAEASQDVNGLIDRLFSQGQATLEAADREALTNVLVARTNMNQDEASATIDRWQATVQAAQARMIQAREQAENAAREAANRAAKAISKAAIWSFVALVLGAVAASFGGSLGSMSNLKPAYAAQRSTVPSGRPIFHS